MAEEDHHTRIREILQEINKVAAAARVEIADSAAQTVCGAEPEEPSEKVQEVVGAVLSCPEKEGS